MSNTITRNDFLKCAAAGAAGIGLLTTSALAHADEAVSDAETTEELAPFSFTPGTYVSKQTTGFAEMDITVELSEDAILSVDYEVTKSGEKDYSERFMDSIVDLCNRIVEANSPYVDGISGATLCTDATIDGVKDCMEQAGYEFPEEAPYVAETPSWLGEAPVIDESEIVDTIKADIIVIGCGNAGLACAVSAAEVGKKVAVIEEQAKDSIFWYGLHDIASVNSNYCLEAGCPEINKAEFMADYQRRTLNYTDPRLVKTFVDNSGEMVDWLIENSPQDVVDATYVHTMNSHVEYFADGTGINGYKCWKGSINLPFNQGAGMALVEKAESLGATWYWEHKGIVLETETTDVPTIVEQVQDDGVDAFVEGTVPQTTVKGVIAQDSGGAYHRFVGDSYVLSCGGYGANSDMYRELQQNQRELYDAHGLDVRTMRTAGFGRDGSGIKMGMWAGGSMDPIQRTLIAPEVVYQSDQYSVNILIRQGTYRFALWLDNDMERFCDESFMGVFGLMARMERNKPGRHYAFFDNKWQTLVSRSAPEHFCATEDDASLAPTLAAWVERGPLGEETSGSSGETTWSTGTPCHFAAQTLDELFEYMGFDDEQKSKAHAAIDRYNELCAAGEDSDFGRDPKLMLPIDEPPFYGIIQVQEKPAIGTCTLNGLVVDHTQHVLDKNYNPIVGLYASGNNSGGRFGTHYSTSLQGLSLGFALTLGRVLGKQLASA